MHSPDNTRGKSPRRFSSIRSLMSGNSLRSTRTCISSTPSKNDMKVLLSPGTPSTVADSSTRSSTSSIGSGSHKQSTPHSSSSKKTRRHSMANNVPSSDPTGRGRTPALVRRGSLGSRLTLPLFGPGHNKDDTSAASSAASEMKNKKKQQQRGRTPVRGGKRTKESSKEKFAGSPQQRKAQKVRSKAARDDEKESFSTMEPAGDLQRLDSRIFHSTYSSDEEEVRNGNKGKAQPVISPRASPASPSGRQRQFRPTGLERTWSVGAFSMSMHSTGESTIRTNLYLDDDSDDEDFDTDDEADYTLNKGGHCAEEGRTGGKKKKAKKSKKAGRRPTRRMTKKERKRQKAAEEAAAAMAAATEVILEEEEEEDEEDEATLTLEPASTKMPISKNDFHSSMSTNYDDEDEDDKQSSPYRVPAFVGYFGRGPVGGEITIEDIGLGYNSDSALVRKKAGLRQSQEKKRGGKKTKEEKLPQPPTLASLLKADTAHSNNDDSVDYNFDEVDEISVAHKKAPRRNSTGAMNETIKKKRSKKDKKKKQKRKDKRSATSGSDDDNDDDIYLDEKNDAGGHSTTVSSSSKSKKSKRDISKRMEELDNCFKDVDEMAEANFVANKTYDERFAEVEKFEAMLYEERESLQKERETIAFERESLELQLNEEIQKCEALEQLVKDLEQQMLSQRLSHAGNNAELESELEELKSEKFDLSRQLLQKEKEVEDLKRSVKDMKIMEEREDFAAPEITDGKSRERLQGELLQAIAKLSEKDARLDRQTRELDETRRELAALQDGSGVPRIKAEMSELKQEKRELEQELSRERKETTTKLREKDDTIEYLMGELARLKQDQSRGLTSPNYPKI